MVFKMEKITKKLENKLSKLIEFVYKEDNIRALVLQGSYVNPVNRIDEFSDLDPLFYCNDTDLYTKNNEWKNYFGVVISSFSDEWDTHYKKSYTRLCIYDDYFKYDFGFTHINNAKHANEMGYYKVIIDKDNIIPRCTAIDETRFYIKKPTKEEFHSFIETFFFDLSYIVKSILRREDIFLKYIEYDLNNKAHKLLSWYASSKHDFKVNLGSGLRYIMKYMSSEEKELLQTIYIENSIDALYNRIEFVHDIGMKLATVLEYEYPLKIEQDMKQYCDYYLKRS